jgi:thiol-disulfide isomerase/thioredoxin
MKAIELNKTNVKDLKTILSSKKPVLILYHWSGCGHCITFMPVWKEMVEKFNKENVDCNCVSVEYSNIGLLPSAPKQYENNEEYMLTGVRAFPTIKMIKDKKIVDTFMDERKIDSLRTFVNKYVDKKPDTNKKPAKKKKTVK